MEPVIGIITDTYHSMSATLAQTGPKLAAAAIVVVAGLLVSRLAKAGVYHLLRVINFDGMAKRLGLSDALDRAGIEKSASEITCTVVYWTGLTFTLLATLGTMGIAGTPAMTAILGTIPKVILAAAILVFGLNISAFFSNLAQAAAVNAEVHQARLIRNVMHFGLSTLVVLLAVKQFDISSTLLGHAFLIFFGATSLAGALAFGLGCRDLAADIANSRWRDEQKASKALSDASELGNDVFPSSNGKSHRRNVNA